MVIKLDTVPEGNGRYSGRIGITASPLMFNRLQELPGALYCKKLNVWTLPLAWPSALCLGAVAQETRQQLASSAELRTWVQQQSTEWAELSKLSQLVMGTPHDGWYAHQDADVAWLAYPGGPLGRLLLNEMGIGKTRSVIWAMQQRGLLPALVVCPKVAAISGWQLELARVAPELRVGIALGGAVERTKVFAQAQAGELDVVVTGYEVMKMHTRFAGYGGAEPLKRCVKCGGPPLAPRSAKYLVKIPHSVVADLVDLEALVGMVGLQRAVLLGTALAAGKPYKNWLAVTVDHASFQDLQRWSDPELTGPLGAAAEAHAEKLAAMSLAACQTHEKELNRIPWKLVVADEAHRLLSASSQTRMAMAGLLRTAATAPRWALTGTPIGKRADGLWSLLNFVDPVAWPVKKTWVDRYCEQGFNYAGFWEIVGFKDSRSAELHRTLDPASRRVLKEQALDLPPMLRGGSLVRVVTMGTEQARVYAEMRDEMVVDALEGRIVAANAAVQTMRLCMFTSATGVRQDGGKLILRMPSAKLDELEKMIREEELGQQYAAAFSSRVVLRLAVAELVRRGVLEESQIGIIDGGASDSDRARDIAAFQVGGKPTVFFTYGAGGIAVTLHAAETLVLFERSWINREMLQGLGRVHRAGMPDRPVSVVDLITENTVEMEQLARLDQDADLLEAVVHDRQRLADFYRTGRSGALVTV